MQRVLDDVFSHASIDIPVQTLIDHGCGDGTHYCKMLRRYSRYVWGVDILPSGSYTKQIKDLQKRNAQLEEENLILKKAIAIFTPHSNKD